MEVDRQKYREVVEPAIKWLNENCNPHTIILISTNHAELLSGEAIHRTDKFIKD